MAVVALRLVAPRPAGQQHEDELALAPSLGQPDGLRVARLAALMHHLKPAELAVEGDAGGEVADMQRDMGEGGGHDGGQ